MNASTVLDNLIANTGEKTCWFCKKRSATKEAAVTVPMHRTTNVSRSGQYRTKTGRTARTYTYTYNSATVDVPRCQDCMREHKKAGTASTLAGLGGFFLILIFGTWVGGLMLSGLVDYPRLYGLVISFCVACAWVGVLVWHETWALERRGTAPLSKKLDYPGVKSLLAAGWKEGSKPR